MGLIQREIEKVGIPTIGISIVKRYTEKIKPPRTVFLALPFGHPLGEPYNEAQQKRVLINVLNALHSIKKPGCILDLPYKWEKESYNMENAA